MCHHTGEQLELADLNTDIYMAKSDQTVYAGQMVGIVTSHDRRPILRLVSTFKRSTGDRPHAERRVLDAGLLYVLHSFVKYTIVPTGKVFCTTNNFDVSASVGICCTQHQQTV